MEDKVVCYTRACQVTFLRPDLKVPLYERGIAYWTEVIAARDGEHFFTRDILRCARENGIDEDYAIVEGMEWKPINIE